MKIFECIEAGVKFTIEANDRQEAIDTCEIFNATLIREIK